MIRYREGMNIHRRAHAHIRVPVNRRACFCYRSRVYSHVRTHVPDNPSGHTSIGTHTYIMQHSTPRVYTGRTFTCAAVYISAIIGGERERPRARSSLIHPDTRHRIYTRRYNMAGMSRIVHRCVHAAVCCSSRLRPDAT